MAPRVFSGDNSLETEFLWNIKIGGVSQFQLLHLYLILCHFDLSPKVVIVTVLLLSWFIILPLYSYCFQTNFYLKIYMLKNQYFFDSNLKILAFVFLFVVVLSLSCVFSLPTCMRNYIFYIMLSCLIEIMVKIIIFFACSVCNCYPQNRLINFITWLVLCMTRCVWVTSSSLSIM